MRHTSKASCFSVEDGDTIVYMDVTTITTVDLVDATIEELERVIRESLSNGSIGGYNVNMSYPVSIITDLGIGRC